MLIVCGFVLLAIGLVFGQTIRHEFINFDDDVYVYHNPSLAGGLTVGGITWAFTTTYANFWHPMTWMSYLLDFQLYGLKPWGYHLTNVLLHAATAIILLLILWRMTRNLWASAFVAAVFAIHPLHVESVAWVAERKDVLSGLFFVLTLTAYVRYADVGFSLARYLTVVVLFALGLMAKPILVMLPVVLWLLDYWPLGRMTPPAADPGDVSAASRSSRFSFPVRLIVDKIPLLLLAAVFCVVTPLAEGKALAHSGSFPWTWRIGNALISYVAYLGQLFYPAGLAVLYPRRDHLPSGQVLGALLLLTAITVSTLLWRRRRPYLLVGWLWYLAVLLPVIGLVQFGAQAVADRFMYLPQIGLCMALVWGVADLSGSWSSRRWLCSVTSALLLALLVGCAWRQASFWRDSETQWTHTLACTTKNALAHANLGCVLVDRGQVDKALMHFQEAIRIRPDFESAHANLGCALADRGRVDEALIQYHEAIRLRPDCESAWFGLGKALAGRGQFDEAVAAYRKALELRPSCADTYNYLGLALAGQGQFAEAVAQYQKALRIQPDCADARGNLGSALGNCGRFDEAIPQLQQALEVQPKNAEWQSNLGNALAARGRFQDALAHYRKAREIQPDHLGAQKNLAWLRATCPVAMLRNGAEAMELAQRVNLLSDGKQPDALDTLAAAYAELGWFPDALATAHKALDMARHQKRQALVDALRARIALYEVGKPYHQPVSASEAAAP